MYDISAIKNYILFLKTQLGLSITLHPSEKDSLILASELMTFNIHDHPYCIYVKTFPKAQKHCIERQEKIWAKCREGSFCGTCFAGVREFVYPISNGKETVGFISVSGYCGEALDSHLRTTAQNYGIPLQGLRSASEELRHDLTPKEQIDALLIPLCNMLELAYLKSADDGENEEQLLDRIVRYIKRYHTQDITLEDICAEFSCSRSYISHAFPKILGKSFRTYLTEIRLEDAKSLLRHSKLSVTEIASSVGFGDSAYFSNVFKHYTGQTPSAYRKALR